MRRFTLALVALTVIAPVLAACDSLDTIEIFDSKKKLPGERKPVFPEGVPGVAGGIPPELMKGYREPETALPDPVAAAAEAAAATKPPARPKPNPEPRPQRTASRPPPADSNGLRSSFAPSTPANAPPARPTTASSAPAPPPPPPQSAPLPWPTTQPAAPWPTQ